MYLHFRPSPKRYYAGLLLVLLIGCFAAPNLAAQTLEGMVISEDREPLVGVTVWCIQQRDIQRAETDADGVFRFSDLSVAFTSIIAYKEGRALSGWSGVYWEDLPLMLIMRPAATLTMRLIDRRYNPVPGVRVKSMMLDDQFLVPVERLADHGFPMIRSDDEGHLDIPMLNSHGFAQLILTHIDHADTRVTHLPVRENRQNIVMSQGGLLRGRVTADGEGVANAEVSVFRPAREGVNEYANLFTDPEGFFQVRLQLGEYQVRAAHPSYASPGPVSVNVRSHDEATEITALLVNARVIAGRILRPGNEPAVGVWVRYRSEDGVVDEAISDFDGDFRLQVARGEGVLRVSAPPGFMTEMLSDIPVDLQETMRVNVGNIQLEPLPVLEGQVVDDTGAAVEGAVVQTMNLPYPIWVFTDADGNYELPLDYVPDVEHIVLRAEHPRRLLRYDFGVNLENLELANATLRSYEPLDEQILEHLRGNNLQFLMNEPAPEIDVEDWFNTNPVTLEDLQGQVVVLTFWGGFDDSDWNRIRMEELKAYYRLFQDADDVVFLNIHDSSSDPEDIEDYMYQFGIPFGCGRDAEPFVTFVEYGINFIPQTVLIDKEGVVRYYQTEGRLLELIKALRLRG